MSLETPTIFSLEDIKYGIAGEDRLLEPRFDEKGRRRVSDYIHTKLFVSHNAGTKIPDYRWEDRQIWFNTSNNEQFLEIEIISPQEWQEKPRFHLHKLHANSLHRIREVKHRSERQNNWLSLGNKTDELPEHTRFIRLTLTLPGQGTATSFKLCVYSRDRELQHDINCDPLVGNDPPAQGGDF